MVIDQTRLDLPGDLGSSCSIAIRPLHKYFVAGFAAMALAVLGGQANASPISDEVANYLAKRLVGAQLKDPDSAKFSDIHGQSLPPVPGTPIAAERCAKDAACAAKDDWETAMLEAGAVAGRDVKRRGCEADCAEQHRYCSARR